MRTTAWSNVQKLSATSTGADKTFDVPSGHAYVVNSVSATLSASIATGARQLDMSIYDSSDTTSYNEMMRYRAGATLSSNTTGTVIWAVGHVNDTAFVGGFMQRTLGGSVVVPAGGRIRLYDSAGISTADAVRVQAWVEDLVE